MRLTLCVDALLVVINRNIIIRDYPFDEMYFIYHSIQRIQRNEVQIVESRKRFSSDDGFQKPHWSTPYFNDSPISLNKRAINILKERMIFAFVSSFTAKRF